MSEPHLDSGHDDDDGMRLSRRILLVGLTLVAFALTMWTSLRPNLDDGFLAIGFPNPIAGLAWFVLFVALLLQVSSKIKAFAIGIAFIFFWPTPLYASMGAMALQGQFIMERTTATVTKSDLRGQGPVPVTFTYDDGTTERGISLLGKRFSHGNEYIAPPVGSRVHVLRDPTGWLPPRTASTDEGTSKGAPRALLLGAPGFLGLLVLLGASVSALTRRESFVMSAASPTITPQVSPSAGAGDPGAPRASS